MRFFRSCSSLYLTDLCFRLRCLLYLVCTMLGTPNEKYKAFTAVARPPVLRVPLRRSPQHSPLSS